nr:NAD(P)H-dependent oxidoreductase [uncultured Flavobacterium sp.]
MRKKVLHIISSPRGESSISKKLGNTIVEKIRTKYPNSVFDERKVATNQPPFLDEIQIVTLFTPPENRSLEQLNAIRYSDEVIAELLEADIIVIDAPLYNFGVVASLKAYLNLIARPHVTFKFNKQGQPEGLLKNKKVYIAFSAGHIYSEGASQSWDFVVPYLKQILGFIGLTDISVFSGRRCEYS